MPKNDNCIPFGEDIANIYDQTRPFIPAAHDSQVLLHICEKLIESFGTKDVITLLEVGAGTGRVTLAIARAYAKAAKERDWTTRLSIECYEKSPDMRTQLIRKLGESPLSTFGDYVDIVTPDPADIRDFQPEGPLFDAALAHWVFHVMSDWRVATLAIDQAIHPDGLMILLREQSPLYKAIDGDLSDLTEDPITLDLWKSFHRGRRDIARQLSPFQNHLPARFRLGSRVIDSRVDGMFSALGWSSTANVPVCDSWDSEMPLSFVIDTIIRRRAFTNMRLFTDDSTAKKRFAELADQLLTTLPKRQLSHRWRFSCTLTCTLLHKDAANSTDDVSSLLLHVAQDTLGRRWRRRLDESFHRDALWRRLFHRLWYRLNSGPLGEGPLHGVSFASDSSISGLYVEAPFSHACAISLSSAAKEEVFWETPRNRWNCIGAHVENAEPYAIFFGAVEAPPGPPEEKWIHPHIHEIQVSEQAIESLKGIPKPESHEPEPSKWTPTYAEAMKLVRNEPRLKQVVEEAKRIGALAFGDDESAADFLIGLSCLAHGEHTKALYVFPFRADFSGPAAPAMGMMLGGQRRIRPRVLRFIWLLGEVLFNEYLEELVYSKGALTATKEQSGSALAAVVPCDWNPSDRWKKAQAPAVLVVVAAEVEFRALTQAAGIRDNLEAWAIGKDNHIFYDLGFPNLPVWAVFCEAGSIGTGGAALTIHSALKTLQPKPFAVIMPGIAFGLKPPAKQRFGDILISKQLHLYDVTKQVPKGVISRSDKPRASAFLLNLFRSNTDDWLQHREQADGTAKPRIAEGVMMSGETLVNDPALREYLLDLEPEALGGEMEGGGVYSAAQRELIHWIVVKAVCDRGMDKGDEYQEVAARNAVDFALYVLRKKSFADAINENIRAIVDAFKDLRGP